MRHRNRKDGISVVKHCLTTRSQAIADRTVKESLTVQTRKASEASDHATLDHFRGIRKMIGQGKNRRRHHDGR